MKYVSFKNDSIGDFIGYASANEKYVEPQYSFKQWDSRDNELLYYRYMAENTNGYEQKKWEAAVKEELFKREQIDRYFASLTKEPRFYQSTSEVKNFNCYKKAVNQFIDTMGMSDYAFMYFNVLANICNEDGHAF